MPRDEIEFFFSNSIHLNEWGPLYNFARPANLLRWRREKKKLSLELLCAMKANSKRPTLMNVAQWFGCSRRRLPTTTKRRYTCHLKDADTIFFIFWPHKIILKKSRLKNLKCSLTFGKKVDPMGYAVIKIYKKYKNSKITLKY
jgi:hypothetical protein